MDLEQSEINLQLRRTAEFLFHFYGPYYKLKEENFICPDENQRSKTFSWIEAFLLCRSTNATLPEFYSRKEQEEFITVVKSGNVLFFQLRLYTLDFIKKPRCVMISLYLYVLMALYSATTLFRLYSPVGILKKIY